ncbi:MAG TPA: hypothetical protein DCG54_07555 [Anaerolineae bacterium]|jgi:hypothetical protein|nr:hypothetical protein [Anaerolineae bacterium]
MVHSCEKLQKQAQKGFFAGVNWDGLKSFRKLSILGHPGNLGHLIYFRPLKQAYCVSFYQTLYWPLYRQGKIHFEVVGRIHFEKMAGLSSECQPP